MSEWEILRRQVAIGGIAHDATGVLAGSLVQVRREGENALIAETRSRPDGSFYVLNLADGEYSVSAMDRNRTLSNAAVVRRDTKGSLQMVWLDLQFASL